MIQSFRHEGLKRLWNDGDERGVGNELVDRVRRRLSALDAAQDLADLRIPGWRLHKLQGRPQRHAIDVNGPWRITFQWREGDALRVDLEQYH